MTAIIVATPERMAELGARVAAWLRAGDVVALNGELGAGKTTFTRGLGDALGVRGTVTSPTFVLARTHQRVGGAPPLVHVDAYRLGSAAELDDLDIDLASSITVIEWAGDLLEGLTDSVLSIRIDRPTGAAKSNSGGATGGSASDPAAPTGSYDSEPIEPRTVTVVARGPGWADREQVPSLLAERSGGDSRDPP